jgi:hypothetical protein
VTIVCDIDAFKKESKDFDADRLQIKFYAKLVGQRLDVILDMIGQQMNGVVLVRHDNIEIVPRARAAKELGLKLGPDDPFPTLVHQFFTKVPLEKALAQLADRYNQNILLSPTAQAKAAMPITLRLTNTPIDRAIETAAEVAELKAVRNSNIWLVTTKEHAATLRTDPPMKAKAPTPQVKSPK